LREFDDAAKSNAGVPPAGSRVGEDGVTFKSHIDGAIIRLTPEESMRVQHLLGADIIMAFDDCPPADCGAERLRQALDRTHRWAEICKLSHERMTREGLGHNCGDGSPGGGQALFGIVQGGTNLAARAESARFLTRLDLPGYALGGLAVGEGHERMVETIATTAPLLPENKPRYLMGVGYPRDIVAAVAQGIDMFDCVLPTRNGRNAQAFTAGGAIRLRNSKFSQDAGPIEEGCDCYACRNFTRGAIRHYFFAGEMLGPILVSLHNIRFYQRFMADLRSAISRGRFTEFTSNDPRCRVAAPEATPDDPAPAD
jgi:queuine tRNA-ribosyltransferase